MKKNFTLFLLIFIVGSFKTIAQGNTCNAEFAFTFINSNTVKFNPAVTDSILNQHIWNFGDATPTSNQVSPTHSYAANGSYTVVHTIILRTPNGTPVCTQSFTRVVTIHQTTVCTLTANFSWASSNTNPLRIEFANLSTPLSPTDSIKWTFGDGTVSSEVNPTHTYANAGTYTVCLRVKKNPNTNSAPCVREICKPVVVQPECNLVANFIWRPDSVNAQKIWFTNTSTPLHNTDSIRWTFGDGTSSNVLNPNHTYTHPGTYTVCLRVQKRNTAGTPISCVREICKTVTVTATCNFTVNYSWSVDPLNYRKINFINLTSPNTPSGIATWTFGDGTSANSWNAVHEYARPGRYYVCLKVQLNNTCYRIKCDSITILEPAPPCNNQSNFNFIRSTASNQTLSFIPVYQNHAAQYTWTFGDGTGSLSMLPNHTYTSPGAYTTCLTVWRNANCASTTCKVVQAGFNSCDTAHVSYTFLRDIGMPNKISFFAQSSVPLTDQVWTITRLLTNQTITIHQNNPVYLFADTGNYRVCLRAITSGGCVKEFCNTIRIERLTQPNSCVLQVYPNPVTSVVNVNIPLSIPQLIDVKIYNSMNTLVAQRQQAGVAGSNIVSLNISNLPFGVYVIRATYGNTVCYGFFQKL